jgi:hypothetical protein
MTVAEGLGKTASVGAVEGGGVAVNIRVRLGFGVDVHSSRAGHPERVSTPMPPIKTSTQIPDRSNKSVHCRGVRSRGMGTTGSPTEMLRSLS